MAELDLSPEPNLKTGPPAGFGKGVNDYLNLYVTVSDGKAAVLLAANVALIGGILIDGKVADADGTGLLGASVVAFSASAVLCASVIYPRLPSGHTGLIFWEDIRNRTKRTDYVHEIRDLDDAGVESEYASQNWHVSSVLHDKMRIIQYAIKFFAAGIALVGLWAVIT